MENMREIMLSIYASQKLAEWITLLIILLTENKSKKQNKKTKMLDFNKWKTTQNRRSLMKS